MNSAYRILIFIIVMFGIVNYAYMYIHEQAHVQIFKTKGIDSEVHYGIFKWTTTPLTNECDSYCQLAQDNVEAFGYNMQGIMMFIFVGVMSIFLMFVEMGLFDND